LNRRSAASTSTAVPRAAAGSSLPPDAVVASIIVEVRSRRGVVRRDLPRVPSSARAALDDALRAAGLEVTRSAVRVPARTQLLALLENGAAVDEKGLAQRLVCVTGPETKAIIAGLLRDGGVRRVERPAGPALRLPSDRTVNADRTARLAGELERALRWIRKARRARGSGADLLECDVAELLERLGTTASLRIPQSASVPTARQASLPAASSLLDRLTDTAMQLAALHGGLAPVPMLVRSLHASTAAVHAALLEGHARGWFELQPESSMGRLGAEDLALCLPGPEGTHLSWVRPLKGASSADAKAFSR
jgi:hypothetical protein